MKNETTAFHPVSSIADLKTLNHRDIIEGYLSFERGDSEPGDNRGRAFWHGWMNAARDYGERHMTPEARQLANEIIGDQRAKR